MTLLPTRSRTVSIFLASRICFDKSGRSISQRSAPSFSSVAKRIGKAAITRLLLKVYRTGNVCGGRASRAISPSAAALRLIVLRGCFLWAVVEQDLCQPVRSAWIGDQQLKNQG